MSQVTVGGFEIVSLPEFGLENVVAKIDTGAYSGAIHCTDITVKKNSDGKSELSFLTGGQGNSRYKTTNFTQKRVRSATGHEVERCLLTTKIVVQGKTYDVTIGVSDRSTLTFPVLIGRKFIRQQNMLIDVNQNSEHDPEGARE